MWRYEVEQERVEEAQRLEEHIIALEKELRIKNAMIDLILKDLKKNSRWSYKELFDIYEDMAKENIIKKIRSE